MKSPLSFVCTLRGNYFAFFRLIFNDDLGIKLEIVQNKTEAQSVLFTQKPRYPPLRIASFEREDEIINGKCFQTLFETPRKDRQ